jgi:hypothetical protein
MIFHWSRVGRTTNRLGERTEKPPKINVVLAPRFALFGLKMYGKMKLSIVYI